jgi:hypothetical protein
MASGHLTVVMMKGGRLISKRYSGFDPNQMFQGGEILKDGI